MRNFKVRALLGLLLLLLSGLTACNITRPGGAPAANLAGLYRDQVGTDTVTLAQLPWRTLFTDSALQTLIARGIANNLDLQVAGARVREADAYFRQSQAAFLPSLSATGSTARSQQAAFAGQETRLPATTQFQFYGSASWEADVWGKLRNSRRSYLALLLQSEAYRRAVQTSVVGSIANYYYQLLALDQQLAITQQTVQNRILDVETSRKLLDAGIVTGAAVVQSEAIRYAAEVIIPDQKQQIRETENALSLLLGVAPAAIGRRGTLADQPPVPALQIGVPAQLLRFRPDVQQAEYAFRSAFALTNAARAYFYPALTLTSSGGYSSFDFGRLLDPAAVFGSLAGGLVQPILTRGVNRARLRVSEAQQLEAQLNFQTALLTAGQEVSNSLYSYQAAQEKMVIRAKQLDALVKSVTYSQALLANGFANYTEVLTAQQNLLTAQLNGVNDQQQRLQAVTNLYRALGGGWQ